MDQKKEINVGLALLKFWMCFEVVMVHSWSLSTSGGVPPPGTSLFSLMRPYAVPVFMPLAFFFAAGRFAANDTGWLKARFTRLVLPFAFWSILTFCLWRLLSPHFPAFAMTPTNGAFWTPNCGTDPVPISFEYLGLQLLLGTTRTLGSQMWFQAVLIILTALFALFFRCVKPRHITCGLVLLFVGAAMLEHSGFNRWLFEGLRYEVCNPLGRIIAMTPYAALGLFLGFRRDAFASVSTAGRWGLVAGGVALVTFLLNYEVFVSPPGFYYKGFKMLFVSLGLIMAFHFLPCNRLPACMKSAIAFVTRFTMGVYFVHILLGHLLEALVFPSLGLTPHSFSAACAVFAVSWVFCFALSFIPCKWVKALIE